MSYFAKEKWIHIRFDPFYLSLWTWRENGIAIIFNVYVFDALICSKPKLEHSDLSNKHEGSNKQELGLFFIYVGEKKCRRDFFFLFV